MKKRILLFLILTGYFTGNISAQEIIVKGVVLDETNNPLIGATVITDSKSKATVTDMEGKFSINCNLNENLKISFIGYLAQKVKVSEKLLTIKMEPQQNNLNDVVVVGYGTQKRSDISTAVSSVRMADIEKSGARNVLDGIQGKVSGVQIISNDGSLNGGMTFRIRGNNSITGGTQPLFVIDGVAQPISTDENSNPMGGLNPSDIESLEVLKDAAAAAIYGAEGSNGVVLITTKKGSEQAKLKIEISVKSGMDLPPTNKYMKVLTPEEYAYRMQSDFGSSTDLIEYWNNVVNNQLWNDPTKASIPMNEIQQQASNYELNASMSGGSKQQNYFFSIGYLSRNGIIKGTEYDRLSLRLNLLQKLNSSMEIGANFSYSSSQNKNAFTDNSSINGVYIRALQASPFMIDPQFVNLFSLQGIDRLDPFNMITDHQSNNAIDELNGKVNLKYNIIAKDLTFNTNFSVRKYLNNTSGFNGPNTSDGRLTHGKIEFDKRNDLNWAYDAQLQYNKSFGKHTLTAMAAFEAKNWVRLRNYQKTTNLTDYTLGIYGVNTGLIAYNPDYTFEEYSLLSYIGRMGYTYDERYVFSASLRRDGSSRFGSSNKFGNFPALSFAWRAKQEEFLKSVDLLSDLKLRASYGVTGNNQIPSYQSLAMLSLNKVVMDGTSVDIGLNPSNLQNKNLKWETSHQFNAGLDLSILKNRLSLTADFYYKRIDDMLIQINIPSTTGFSKTWENAGSMMNKGMEYALKAVLVNGNKFKWTVDFNIAFNQNKLLSLANGQYQEFFTRGINPRMANDVLLRVGMPVGVYYGYISDGVYNNATELLNGYPGSNLKFNDLKIVDTNKDGKIDPYDRVPIANVNPIHTGGLGTNLSYGGFELYTFFRWSYGNDEINGAANTLSYATTNPNILSTVYQSLWSPTNPSNNYPYYVSNSFGLRAFRSELVEDGSFLRLATLSLSYSLRPKALEFLGLKKCDFSVTGSNLWLLTRYSGFDPEANTGSDQVTRLAPGLDMSPYPRPQSVLFSIKLGF